MILSSVRKTLHNTKQMQNNIRKIKQDFNIFHIDKQKTSSAQSTLIREQKKSDENYDLLKMIKKQVTKIYNNNNNNRKKVGTKENDVWIIKELPSQIFFSIPDTNFRKYAILAFEHEQLAHDMRNVIYNFELQHKFHVIEKTRISYILDICESTNKNLIVFRRDYDNNLICKKYV